VAANGHGTGSKAKGAAESCVEKPLLPGGVFAERHRRAASCATRERLVVLVLAA
jgi:hypothetical protein